MCEKQSHTLKQTSQDTFSEPVTWSQAVLSVFLARALNPSCAFISYIPGHRRSPGTT